MHVDPQLLPPGTVIETTASDGFIYRVTLAERFAHEGRSGWLPDAGDDSGWAWIPDTTLEDGTWRVISIPQPSRLAPTVTVTHADRQRLDDYASVVLFDELHHRLHASDGAV